MFWSKRAWKFLVKNDQAGYLTPDWLLCAENRTEWGVLTFGWQGY